MVKIAQFEKYYTNIKTKRNAYYQEYAQRYMKNKKAIKWNWPAALFGVGWLIHRKAYRGLVLYVLFELVLKSIYYPSYGLLKPIVPSLDAYAWDISFILAFMVTSGLYANNLYFWDIQRRMAKKSQAIGTNGFWKTLLYSLLCCLIFVLGLLIAVILSLCIDLINNQELFTTFTAFKDIMGYQADAL